MATISENLQKLSASLEDAYVAIGDRGGTVPSDMRAANLADAINSIPAGGGGAVSKYGVTLSAFLGETNSSGTYLGATADQAFRFSGVKNIDSYAMAYKMARHSSDTTKRRSITVSFPDLTSTNSYSASYWGQNNRDIVSIGCPELTSTGSYGFYYAFQNCTSLTAVNMSKLQSVGTYGLGYAFYGCSGNQNAMFPMLTSIPTYGLCYAFYGNSNLTSMCLSALKNVGNYGLSYAFYNCSRLTDASYPQLTGITSTYGFQYAHYNNTALTSFCLSALAAGATQSYSMRSAFYGCSKLTAADFPALTGYVGSYVFNNAFYGCTSLLSASFPELTAIGSGTSYTYQFQNCFYNCSKLSSVNFPKVKSIGGNYAFNGAFYGCSQLSAIEFPSLTGLTASTSYSYGTFYNNPQVKDFYFPQLSSITNQYMFYTNNTALSGIHFAKVHESILTANAYYSTIWGRGAGKATVSFELNTDGTIWSGIDGEQY